MQSATLHGLVAMVVGLPLQFGHGTTAGTGAAIQFTDRTGFPRIASEWNGLTRRERRANYLKQRQRGTGSKLARKAREGKLGLAVLR